MNTRDLTIRPIESIAEYTAVQRVQREAWGFGPDDTVLHVPLMVALQKYGGLVLGAFAAAELVGFALGFIGRDPTSARLFHYSQIVAALPTWQSRGVGFALKLAQREHALAQGFELMRWAFDPLATRNAYFNFVKLGVVARAYLPDMYGAGRGTLFGSSATDRLIVDWELTSARVMEHLKSTREPAAIHHPALEVPLALTAIRTNEGTMTPAEPQLNLAAPQIGIEVPAQLSATSTSTSAAWRLASRAVFGHYLTAGYVVATIAVQREQQTATYVLQRATP
jgi:predicted GNAT superfamily acetyltransferase